MYGCTHAAVLASCGRVTAGIICHGLDFGHFYFDLHLLICSRIVSRGTRGGFLGRTGLTLHRDDRGEEN